VGGQHAELELARLGDLRFRRRRLSHHHGAHHLVLGVRRHQDVGRLRLLGHLAQMLHVRQIGLDDAAFDVGAHPQLSDPLVLLGAGGPYEKIAHQAGSPPISATLRAASGPSCNSTVKPSSSSTGIFSCTALSYFDPGESPTTTNAVLFDTEPAARPPRAMMASFASSREYRCRVPVTTMDRPSRLRGKESSRSSSIRTPAAAHLRTTSRCQSTANH